jgi:hypothetical protein
LGVCLKAAIEQEHDHNQEQEERGSRSSSKKNYRPPHPKGREGRLFPPEQSLKTFQATKRASGWWQQNFI